MNQEFKNIIEQYRRGEITQDQANGLLNELKEKQGSALKIDPPATGSPGKRPEIAVVGMSGQFPDAHDYETFWQNLLSRHEAVKDLPASYLKGFAEDQRSSQKKLCRAGGILDEKEMFDPLFFNIAPVEAASMNLHQRLILQESWRGLEDAGYNPRDLSNTRVSVFIGAEPTNFFNSSFTGASEAIIAARLSYYLNLKGPAVVLNTGCSSSATAIHLACESLRAYESSAAIAGGVFANLDSRGLLKLFSEIQVLSPSGKCKTFDESADGTILSEGVAVVVLKRLEDAIAGGDHIYGIIEASGANQDGTSNGITAPNGVSQEELIVQVYKEFGINPEDITYVETHGTGTRLGDPVEANALIRAFRRFTKKKNFCIMGSGKPNIGHASAAAGAIGLIKLLLSLREHKIPGLINFNKLNPLINIKGSAFRISTETEDWTSGSRAPLRGALNSFGHSGTNIHLVVKEYIPEKKTSLPEHSDGRDYLATFSARDEEALTAYAAKYVEYLELPGKENISIRDLTYTLQVGREAMDERLGIAARDLAELKARLKEFLKERKTGPGIFRGSQKVNVKNPPGFKDSEELFKTVRRLLIRGEYSKILELWTRGADIDWKKIYGSPVPRRLSLPTYPFAGERYAQEMDLPADETGVKQIHPLVHENTSSLIEQRFTSHFTGDEFFLTDHTFNGQKVLPAVAYLEMARAAVTRAFELGDDTEIFLKNFVWLRAFIHENETDSLHISLVPGQEEDEVVFEIYSMGPGDEPVVHCQGGGLIRSSRGSAALNLDALRQSSWEREVSGGDCYKAFARAGIAFGPAHRGIQVLYSREGEVLARLRRPGSVKESFNQFILHPSMIDSALQAAVGMIMGEGTAVMPFALDEIEISAGCSEEMWVHIRHTPGGGGKKYDLALCDSSGNVAVNMRGLLTREMEVGSSQQGLVLFEPRFKENPPADFSVPPVYAEHVVFLCEARNITLPPGARVVDLAARGASGEERFTGYALQLIEKLREFLLNKPAGPLLVQVLVQTGEEKELFSGFSGILNTLRQENPGVTTQLIELEAASGKEASVLVESAGQRGSGHIRYLRGIPFVSEIKAITEKPEEAPVPWKEQGVYLITGGLGGVGRILAGEIASQARGAVLILTGRSPLDEKKEEALKELENRGAVAEYHLVDVADEDGVRDLVRDVRARHKRLTGVIHSAGIVKDSFLIKKDVREAEAVLLPKVQGTINLDRAIGKEDLEFFILFSSVSGIMGNVGQADYAAANAFLNGFAVRRNREREGNLKKGRTLSVNWPQWKDGGMKISKEEENNFQLLGLEPMSSSTAMAALYQSLALEKDFLGILVGNVRKISENLFALKAPPVEAESMEKRESPGSQESPERVISREEMEGFAEKAKNWLKKLLASVIQMPANKIDPDSSFEKYGIDSILVMQLTTELEKTFGPLSKTLFFEYQNLTSLTGYFVENYRDKLMETLGLGQKSSSSRVKSEPEKGTAREQKAPEKKRVRRIVKAVPRARESAAAPDIAIVGLAGRYPQAENLEELWENLKNGRDCITEIPPERWDWHHFYNENKGTPEKVYTKWGGFIEGVDQFDPLFFNISPRDTLGMDPQERLFLECAYATLEDAGYTPGALGGNSAEGLGAKVGVYVGVMYEEYQLLGAEAQARGRMIALAGSPSSIANRVSYTLNFQGPSMAVDTMCSSSITAIHLACHSLARGECEAAIAGGVNVSIHPNKYFIHAQGMFASSKGRCESFGNGGDGYVPGEGVGAVLLKPLTKAVEAGDHIYGVIKGSAINAGGKTNGYTVPNPVAQGELIKEALEKSGIDPREISYIEAHGTGTALGDPIEINGLTRAFSRYTEDKQFCSIGSIKSNIGHCESAAGIAGVTKVLLQMKHGLLVPSLHSGELNPNIDFTRTPFYVQQEAGEWKSRGPRTAGISSFGAGGANGHLLIQEYIPDEDFPPPEVNEDNPVVILLSAKNSERLKEKVKDLLRVVEAGAFTDRDLAAIAYTLQVGREGLEERLAFTVSSLEDLKKILGLYLEDKAGDVYRGRRERDNEMISLFADDREMREALNKWIEKKKYGKLLDLWVKGISFDWNQLYSGKKLEKISLPAYPFARERYWPVFDDPQVDAKMAEVTRIREKTVLVKEWKKVSAPANAALSEGLVIILTTRETLKGGMKLFREHNHVKTLFLLHGKSGKKGVISTDFYSAPQGKEAYDRFREIRGESRLLGVVDLTAFDREYENSLELETGKLAFLQGLLENERGEGFSLLQVTFKLNPFLVDHSTMQGARLGGLYRMLGAEYKQIRSVTMDGDLDLREAHRLSPLIYAELAGEGKLSECLYRRGERYEPSLETEAGDELIKAFKPVRRFSEEDVILVTGGTRGIGAEVVRHLVERGARKLVLMGREALPPKKDWPGNQDKLKRLQGYMDRGVKILYFNTPLTDRGGLEETLDEIHRALGRVTGVFHLAGVVNHNPAFIRKDPREMEEVWAPKVKGTVTLHRVLEGEPLEFFVLFSSVSSVAPTLSAGQSDYAMANSFMNYYARNRGSGVKAILWPTWGEAGMITSAGGLTSPVYRNTGLENLKTREGLALLDYLMDSPLSCSVPAVICPGEFKLQELLKTEIPFTQSKVQPTARPVVVRRPVRKTVKKPAAEKARLPWGGNLEPAIRAWVAGIMKSELKLLDSQIDPDKPFNEYGIDSVIIAQVAQVIQKEVDSSIAPSVLLENQTIAELSRYFLENYRARFEEMLEVAGETDAGEAESPREEYEKITFLPGEDDDLAVVGIACRFPGAPTKEEYWNLLASGIRAIKPVPSDRWKPLPGRTDYGGWVSGIEMFDPGFFKLKDNDAFIMDPQARLILEESLKVIYDAGYNHEDLSGQKIGVFIGGRSHPNPNNLQEVLKASNPILGTGQNYLATNISRFFNFTGPSMVVDTACSSGLTALSLASDSLRSGRIKMAMVGAVNLILNPIAHDMFEARNILSKTGEFHIFDKKSGGEVIGEGAGLVLVKRLEDAVQEGDRVYGVVKALGINNDGRTLGPGSPNINTQKSVMREALALSGKEPGDVGYIEVNGGGSPVIDSIEIKAVSEVYGLADTARAACSLGSIKPNIGHLLLTSGMAGFIRCLLSLHHKAIPPFLSATEPFGFFDFQSSRVKFNRELTPWSVESGRKRTAVQNSFPDGGTNCHVVLEEFVPPGDYKQARDSVPAPVLRKRAFPLVPVLSPGRGLERRKPVEPVIISNNHSMEKLKNKYKKAQDEEVKPLFAKDHVWGTHEQ